MFLPNSIREGGVCGGKKLFVGGEERERRERDEEQWYVCMYVCMYVCTRSGICSLGLFQDLNRGPTTLRAPKLPTYDICAI